MILATLLYGCENELANKAVTQDEKITSFLESEYADVPVIYNKGVNRIVLQEGDSTLFAAPGDLVSFEYDAHKFTTSIGTSFATGETSCYLGRGELIDGLEYGIEGMCPGEKAYIIFSCKYGYKETVAGIGRDEALVFEVVMNDISRE